MPTQQPIEIRLQNSELIRCGSEATARALIYDRCIEAGMPLQFTPFSGEIRVTAGVLETRELHELDALLVRWEPWEPPPEPAPQKPTVWSRIKRIASAVWNA